MQTQRTLFFGKKPAKTPKKDGENPPVPERRFTALSPEDIEIRFDNNTATQFGGYPLWGAFLKEVCCKAMKCLNGGLIQVFYSLLTPLTFLFAAGWVCCSPLKCFPNLVS